MSDDPSPILSFSHVTVEADPAYDSAVWDVSFSLSPGELALVRLERTHLRLPIGDVAQGVIDPDEGAVCFFGKDWRTLSPGESSARRGRIARVFEARGWISNLDVDENILLAQRHHTRRKSSEIANEAAGLARLFGLPGLPRGRPTEVRPQDLQRAACVRAFMGKPELLVLERPTLGIYPEIMPALINAIRSARERGAAMLWLTSETGVWNDPGVRPTLKCIMAGSQLLIAGDKE